MSLISGWMGHASNIDVAKLQKEYAPILADGEQLVAAFRLVRDTIVFTTHRLILVNVQGLTGRKTEFLTVPYTSITRFAKDVMPNIAGLWADEGWEHRWWPQGARQGGGVDSARQGERVGAPVGGE